MKPISLFTAVLLAAISIPVLAQKAGPSSIIEGQFLGTAPSIASQIANGTVEVALPGPLKEVNPKRSDANRAVPGKGLPVGGDPLWIAGQRNDHSVPSVPTREPLLIFDVATPNATPTDPTGAVGPNHYVAAFNSAFRIFNKDGEPQTPNLSLATIWPGQSLGDPIIMYDWEADRWFISQFYSNGFLVAVSAGPDPLDDEWYTYQYGTNSFPDYPKYSIWSDGYYVTSNKNSNSAGTTDVVYAMDRTTMLAGGNAPTMIGYPLPGIVTNGFFSPLGFSVSGDDLPPAGEMYFTYVQDDVWGGVSEDHLKVWKVNTDWGNPGNSTIELSQEIATTPFDGLFDGGSFSNIPQPAGPDIDALQATVMYMASYRRFSGHNSVLLNWVVDLDGDDDYSGVRWVELRQDNDGDDWYIYQEGTYTQPDGHSAFCGSMAMDSNGNIGMGYTVCSSSQAPSLRYTGRYSSDPLGEMTLEEGIIADEGGSDPSTRYGDYSQLTLDPEDEATFWFIGEHFANNGNRTNTVGTFKLAPVLDLDMGVTDITEPTDGLLTNAESVTITVRNYGILEQTNVPVYYFVDGGDPIQEIVPGPIGSQQDVSYTFTTTSDFSTQNTTYAITAGTGLVGDMLETNNEYTEEVTHLLADDVGVVAINTPETADDLTLETIAVTVENFGGAPQTGFEVEYSIDGAAPVTQVFDETIAPLSTQTFEFDVQGDFTAFADYTIDSCTGLESDQLEDNNCASKDVTHNFCQPGGNCSFGDGFQVFTVSDLFNASGCDDEGYGDYTNLTANMNVGETYDLTIVTGYGDQYITVWIDYDDNNVFTDDEKVVEDFLIAPGQNAGEYTATIPFPIPSNAPLGQHLMRAKSNYEEGVDNPCQEVTYGETEDYTVDLLPVGIDESVLGGSELQLSTFGNNQFALTFTAPQLNEVLTFQLFDVNGRVLMHNRVPKNGDQYQFDFDLSYAAAGVYLVRLGNATAGKVLRVVVR